MGDKKNNKLYLIALVLTIICLVLLIQLLRKSLSKDEVYDYAHMESIVNVMYKGEEVTDRATYVTLNSVISQYISSYLNDGGVIDGVKQEDYKSYYKVLSKEYKNHLSTFEYEKVAQTFLQKFSIGGDDMPVVITTDIINGIYEVATREYICKLINECNKQVAYIGIKLNTNETYEITYIE